MDACIPMSWPGFVVTWRLSDTRFEITVTNPDRLSRGVTGVTLDGTPVDSSATPNVDDGSPPITSTT